MNTSCKISLPLKPGSADSAYLRMKINSSGELEVAGAADRCVGVLDEDTDTTWTPGGRQVGTIYRTNGGGLHYATLSEAFSAGDGFVGAAGGEIAVQADLSLAEGQAIDSGAAGDIIRVAYF